MSRMDLVAQSPTKRYSAYYIPDDQQVRLYDTNQRPWKYVLNQAGTLEDLHEIVNGQQPNSADLMWLIKFLRLLDVALEMAAGEMENYGDIKDAFS